MVILTAIAITSEGKGDIMEKECKKMAPYVLNEPGAILYIVHRAIDNPNKFLFYEQYKSQEAFEAHGQTKHFKDFEQAIKSLVENGEMTFYNKVA
jgi:quinol monooxygenase YgiN